MIMVHAIMRNRMTGAVCATADLHGRVAFVARRRAMWEFCAYEVTGDINISF